MSFEDELRALGASELERGIMLEDAKRGAAALHEAKRREVGRPLKYALALVMNPRWRETGAAVRTNVSAVETRCSTCGGERLILTHEYDPGTPYAEVYRRCPDCNPGKV